MIKLSATVGAALKKIAVALLTDKKTWEKLGVLVLALLLLLSKEPPAKPVGVEESDSVDCSKEDLL